MNPTLEAIKKLKEETGRILSDRLCGHAPYNSFQCPDGTCGYCKAITEVNSLIDSAISLTIQACKEAVKEQEDEEMSEDIHSDAGGNIDDAYQQGIELGEIYGWNSASKALDSLSQQLSGKV